MRRRSHQQHRPEPQPVDEPVEEPQEAAAEGARNDAAEGDALAEIERLNAELEAAQAKAAEYSDGWQRERADFANYKRRIERDQAGMRDQLAGSIAKKYLAVTDDLERALKNRPNVGEGGAWAEGIELIYRKLQSVLEAEGITRMPAETEQFDPNRHEAISNEDSPEHQSGEIIEVVQPGYLMGERVLRPALVRVAR